MATTNFVSGTVIAADWLNDVDAHTYDQTTGLHSSSNITYTPAGTGATARTAQDKMRDTVSVKDFGAVGGGVTDDRVFLQTAIDSGAKSLYWPAGTYLVGARLKPVSGQEWVGETGATILKLSNAAATSSHLVMRNADGLEGSLDDFSMHGFILDGNGKDSAFLIFGCQRLRISYTVFRNSGTYGCGIQSRPDVAPYVAQDDIIFDNCQFNNNGSDAPGWDGIDIKSSSNVKLIACTATGNTNIGINIRGKDVDIIGCDTTGNAKGGMLLQTTSTTPSYMRVIGGSSSGCTGGPGLDLQGVSGNTLHVMVSGFQSYGNTGAGVKVSGSGFVSGTVNVHTFGNTLHGVHITGDYVGNMLISGISRSNGTDGVNTVGKNTLFDMQILNNTGTGYRENTGADNNYLMLGCVISGNGTDVGARVGVESQKGFLSARTAHSMRAFPGQSAGLELQASSAGTDASVVAVGTGASVDMRIMTKGNGAVKLFKDNGSNQMASFRPAGSAAVNYPDFITSITGNPVQLAVDGTDTTIDLLLAPKGAAGRVRVGLFTASADVAVVGFIEVKDSGGTTRRLAVI